MTTSSFYSQMNHESLTDIEPRYPSRSRCKRCVGFFVISLFTSSIRCIFLNTQSPEKSFLFEEYLQPHPKWNTLSQWPQNVTHIPINILSINNLGHKLLSTSKTIVSLWSSILEGLRSLFVVFGRSIQRTQVFMSEEIPGTFIKLGCIFHLIAPSLGYIDPDHSHLVTFQSRSCHIFIRAPTDVSRAIRQCPVNTKVIVDY